MSLSRQVSTDLITMVVGMFNAAPGANIYKSLSSGLANNTYSLQTLADSLGNTSFFKTIYPDSLSNTGFAEKYMSILLGGTTTQSNINIAVSLMESFLDQGMSRGSASYKVTELLSTVHYDDPNWGASAERLQNKQLAAQEFSIFQNKSASSLSELQAPLVNVTNDKSSISDNAKSFDVKTYSTFGSTNGNDTITGTEGNDEIFGLSGDDIINALGGDDTVMPGDGNDIINFTAGGKGDSLSYADASSAVTINLTLNTTTGINKNDSFSNTVTSITGSQFDDTLIGDTRTSYDDWEGFRGGKGNDTIIGSWGHNELMYDKELGSSINANLITGKIIDTYGDIDTVIGMNTATGIDSIRGTRLDDIVTSGEHIPFTFRGLAGNDTFNGAALASNNTTGHETMDYSMDALYVDSEGKFGNKGVNVDLSKSTATDGFGDTDTLINIDQIKATQFNDFLKGDSQNNVFDTGGGNDIIMFEGDWGADRISDFDQGKDKIDLSATKHKLADFDIRYDNYSDVNIATLTLISNPHLSISLNGITSIQASDFIFN